MTTKKKTSKWYLWARYGKGHIMYVDDNTLTEKKAKEWAQKTLKDLQHANKISECYITTGEVGDYTKIEIFKDFYWLKKK